MYRVPLESLCNQPPGPGMYRAVLRVGALSDDEAVALSEAATCDQPAEGGEEGHLAQQLVEVEVGVDGVVLQLDGDALDDVVCVGERAVQLELMMM